jgi:hypothetical protein
VKRSAHRDRRVCRPKPESKRNCEKDFGHRRRTGDVSQPDDHPPPGEVSPAACRKRPRRCADDYLTKPVAKTDLLAAIHSRLEPAVQQAVPEFKPNFHSAGPLEEVLGIGSTKHFSAMKIWLNEFLQNAAFPAVALAFACAPLNDKIPELQTSQFTDHRGVASRCRSNHGAVRLVVYSRELTHDGQGLAHAYESFVSAVALCGALGISGCFSRTNNQVCVVSGPK